MSRTLLDYGNTNQIKCMVGTKTRKVATNVLDLQAIFKIFEEAI